MLFCLTAEYTPQSVKALIEHPTKRSEVAAKVVESCGGKLISWYTTLGGPQGIMAIFDVPDPLSASAIQSTACASGALQNLHMKRLLTDEDSVAALRKAKDLQGAYRLPGT